MNCSTSKTEHHLQECALKSEIQKTYAIRSAFYALLLVSFFFFGCTPSSEPSFPKFKISVQSSAIWRITYEDLIHSGYKPKAEIKSNHLGLTNRDKPVPILIHDGGDGFFNQGDWFDFQSEHLPGKNSYYNRYSKVNVYLLDLNTVNPARYPEKTGSLFRLSCNDRSYCPKTLHLEQDNIRVAENDPDNEEMENYYWKRLSNISHQKFIHLFRMPDLAQSSRHPVSLKIKIKKWAQISGGSQKNDNTLPFNIFINSQMQHGVKRIDTNSEILFELEKIPSGLFKRKRNVISIQFDSAQLKKQSQDHTVVVFLDWIELTYPQGMRSLNRKVPKTPPSIKRLQPVLDINIQTQVDYLIISHPRFLKSIQRLADFHRSRGLSVRVVNVFDIYDKFNYGIIHPKAIRAYIQQTFAKSPQPSPRFVLLAGDAIWQPANPLNKSNKNDRNLIPAWKYGTQNQPGPSDHWYVVFDDKNFSPKLAIGRLPVANDAELNRVIDKIINYSSLNTREDWQSKILWITDGTINQNRTAGALARVMNKKKAISEKFIPETDHPVSLPHKKGLLRRFSQKHLIVHFAGHGAHTSWRTAPPDLRQNFDLFSIQDIENLQESRALPIVVAMTCYGASFDRPDENSIGEALLKAENKGAIAVISATWRNTPNRKMSSLLITELIKQKTVGEALMSAKSKIAKHTELLHQYILLGDPALQIPFAPSNAPAKPEKTSDESDALQKQPPKNQASLLNSYPKASDSSELANTIAWKTANEDNIVGFNVLRANDKQGPFAIINTKLIEASSPASSIHSYKYLDKKIEKGMEYYYYVEVMSKKGKKKKLTPIFKAPVK